MPRRNNLNIDIRWLPVNRAFVLSFADGQIISIKGRRFFTTRHAAAKHLGFRNYGDFVLFSKKYLTQQAD